MSKIPNPKTHLRISLIKSFFRIVAGTFLYCGNIKMAGVLLVAAELLGVLEELF